MRIIQKPRRAGKTWDLVTHAAERSAYIVCRDRKEAERVFSSAVDRDLHIPFPITFYEFAEKRYYGKGIKEFLIDDVDALLHFLSYGVNITYCTYTPS
jgi:hypothetical protein